MERNVYQKPIKFAQDTRGKGKSGLLEIIRKKGEGWKQKEKILFYPYLSMLLALMVRRCTENPEAGRYSPGLPRKTEE